MKRIISFFTLVVAFLLTSLFISKAFADIPVEYDRGNAKREREYISAEQCQATPCVITQSGAIRFPQKMENKYQVEIGAIHLGIYRRINLFQESSNWEQKVSERTFNRKPNRKIVDLERLLETGQTGTIYIYGLLLQQALDESDVIGLKIISIKHPEDVKEYFFRYHHEGLKWDIDMAFVQPLNIFHPNPGGIIQAAYSTIAISFSVARALDPEKNYSFLNKAFHAARFNVFTGLLLRKDVASFNGDLITDEAFDGFGGLGFTFFDFLAIGYGGNFIHSPHTTFPFVGLEVGHFVEFLRTLRTDTHTRWKRYLKEETGS